MTRILLFPLLLLIGCHNPSVDSAPSGTADEQFVARWNAHRLEQSCRKIDHTTVVCDDTFHGADDRDRPDHIPDGYHMTFYTDGTSTAPTGWVLKEGPCGDRDLNCED